MEEQYAAVSRRNLIHMLLTRSQLEQLLRLQWLLDQSHPRACQLLAGAVVRFKFKGSYSLRIIQGTFVHAGTLHLALKGLPFGVPPSQVSRFHRFGSPAEFELEGRRELEELLSTLAPHEHALRLLEAAAIAWRLKVALEWAAHLEEYVPTLGLDVLLRDMADATRVADMAAHLELLVPGWQLAAHRQQQHPLPTSQMATPPGESAPSALPSLASLDASLRPPSMLPQSSPASDGSWEAPSDQPAHPSSSQQQRQQQEAPGTVESAGECSLPSYVAKDAKGGSGSRAGGPARSKDADNGEVVGPVAAEASLQQQQQQPRGRPPDRNAASGSAPSSGQLTGCRGAPAEERRAAASSAGRKRPLQASGATAGKQPAAGGSAARRDAKESPRSRKKQRGDEGRSRDRGSGEEQPLWAGGKMVEPWVAKLLFSALRLCTAQKGGPFDLSAVAVRMRELDRAFVAKDHLPCKMSVICKTLESKGVVKLSRDSKGNFMVHLLRNLEGR